MAREQCSAMVNVHSRRAVAYIEPLIGAVVPFCKSALAYTGTSKKVSLFACKLLNIITQECLYSLLVHTGKTLNGLSTSGHGTLFKPLALLTSSAV